MCKHHKCGKTFVSDSDLKRHKHQHQSMDFQCEVRGREFPFQSELASHQTIHSEEKKFMCQHPRCNGKYKTKAEYRRHYKTHRPMSEKHKCPVCNKVFTKAKYLRQHKQAHTDELPFHCKICGEGFKLRRGWKNHMSAEHKNKHRSVSLYDQELHVYVYAQEFKVHMHKVT